MTFGVVDGMMRRKVVQMQDKIWDEDDYQQRRGDQNEVLKVPMLT
jgi:hypothetical protein